jgi:hypothetical protein
LGGKEMDRWGRNRDKEGEEGIRHGMERKWKRKWQEE